MGASGGCQALVQTKSFLMSPAPEVFDVSRHLTQPSFQASYQGDDPTPISFSSIHLTKEEALIRLKASSVFGEVAHDCAAQVPFVV